MAQTAPCSERRLAVVVLSTLTLARSNALTLIAFALFTLSAWQANRDVCPGCAVSEVWLALADGTPIHARLYLPPDADRRARVTNTSTALPAVVVCPGYLANLAFMEIPWAADLTQLGVAALFLDRRGQGRSGGTLWPRPTQTQSLDHLEPDIHAAIVYLRSRAPLIDPERVALLGHSDGATAAITAASADWQVRATVAVSASVAPSELVNHVVPQDLLLVYGDHDRFVLNDTDTTLIARATRGYMAGPGEFGNIADGSARHLVRLSARGHLDVFYSAAARQAILEWLRQALHAPGKVVLSSHRLIWVWIGSAVALLFLPTALPVSAWNTRRRPVTTAGRSGGDPRRLIIVVGAWFGGLLLGTWLAKPLRGLMPGQEGAVFGALVLGPALALGGVAAPCMLARLLRGVESSASRAPRPPGALQQLARAAALPQSARGVVIAAAVCGALNLLLAHHYETTIGLPRLAILVSVLTLSLPCFLVLERWLRWAEGGRAAQGAACLVLLAAATALLSGQLFERMSMAPGYLLAAVLAACAALRFGDHHCRGPTVAVFGALTISWIAATVCQLH